MSPMGFGGSCPHDWMGTGPAEWLCGWCGLTFNGPRPPATFPQVVQANRVPAPEQQGSDQLYEDARESLRQAEAGERPILREELRMQPVEQQGEPVCACGHGEPAHVSPTLAACLDCPDEECVHPFEPAPPPSEAMLDPELISSSMDAPGGPIAPPSEEAEARWHGRPPPLPLELLLPSNLEGERRAYVEGWIDGRRPIEEERDMEEIRRGTREASPESLRRVVGSSPPPSEEAETRYWTPVSGGVVMVSPDVVAAIRRSTKEEAEAQRHAKLPWHIGQHGTVIYNGLALARVFDLPNRDATAAFIIRAANEHYQLEEERDRLREERGTWYTQGYADAEAGLRPDLEAAQAQVQELRAALEEVEAVYQRGEEAKRRSGQLLTDEQMDSASFGEVVVFARKALAAHQEEEGGA